MYIISLKISFKKLRYEFWFGRYLVHTKIKLTFQLTPVLLENVSQSTFNAEHYEQCISNP